MARISIICRNVPPFASYIIHGNALRAFLNILLSAVAVLLALSPFAFRGASWMIPLAYIFGVIMFLNGLAHVTSSIYLRRWMPGVYSSPLLLATSAWLLAAARGT